MYIEKALLIELTFDDVWVGWVAFIRSVPGDNSCFLGNNGFDRDDTTFPIWYLRAYSFLPLKEKVPNSFFPQR